MELRGTVAHSDTVRQLDRVGHELGLVHYPRPAECKGLNVPPGKIGLWLNLLATFLRDAWCFSLKESDVPEVCSRW